MRKLYLFWGLFLGVLISSFAQTYPFRVNVILKQPLAPSWTYFMDDIRQPLTVNVIFNDFAETSWDYRLRLKVENLNTGESSVSYVTESRHNHTAVPGVMETFSGSDLLPYFETLKGTLSKRPSDGNYRFCVEVIDATSEQVLSNSGCAIGFIQTLKNPVVVSPDLGKEIQSTEFLNIPFQWQLMNGVNPIIAHKIRYIFKLYEINDTYKGNLLTAQKNGQAQLIFTSDPLSQPKYNYGITNSDPPLRRDARYLWTVKAYHQDEIPLFEGRGVQQGLSAPSIFEIVNPKKKKGVLEKDSVDAESGAVVIVMKVKDKITDNLIEGAKIIMTHDKESKANLSETTDSRGQFMRNDVLPGTYKVKIQSKGYQEYEDEIMIERDLRNLMINMIPLPSKITGTITDASSGKGLEGAHVELRRVKADGGDKAVASITTKSGGKFEFPKVLGSGKYFLNVENQLYEFYRGKPFKLRGNAKKKLRPIKIGNKVMGIMYGAVKGKISVVNKALANAQVYALTHQEHTDYLQNGNLPTNTKLKAKTSSTGVFEIKNVPAQLKGAKPYILLLPEGELYKEGFGKFEIHEQDDKPEVNLNVQAQPVRVVGVVKNEDGEPILGAIIELYEADNKTVHKRTKTDDQGKYFMDGIKMKPKGYGKILISSTVFKPAQVKDVFKGKLQRKYKADAVLKYNDEVEGVVTNQFDKPVQGVEIEIDGQTTKTDAQGEFKLKGLNAKRSKTANFSFAKMKYNKKFTRPNSAEFKLKLQVLEFVKRLSFSVFDSKKEVAENVKLKILLAEPNSAQNGKQIYTKTFRNASKQTVDLKLPENFAGKSLLFFAQSETGVSRYIGFDLPRSIKDVTPDDLFFTRSQMITLHLRDASAQVTATVKDTKGNPIPDASVQMKGSSVRGKTDKNGKLILKDVPVRDKYEFVVNATSDYIREVVKITNDKDRNQTKFEFDFAVKMKFNKLGDIKELYGFKVNIQNVRQSEGSTLVKLDGKFKIPAKQGVVPRGDGVKTKGSGVYFIEFRNLKYDIATAKPTKESVRLQSTFPVLIGGKIKATLTKPILKDGKITAKSATLEDIETKMVKLKNIGIDPNSLVIYNQSSDKIPNINIQTIERKAAVGYEMKLNGGYPYKIKKVTLAIGKNAKYHDEDPFSRESKKNWQMNFEGDFNFSKSLYKSEKGVNVSITGFEKGKYSASLAGNAIYEKGFIFVGTKLSYDASKGALTGDSAVVLVKSGMGFNIPLEADGVNVDSNGFLKDCALTIVPSDDDDDDDDDEEESTASAQPKKKESFKATVARIKNARRLTRNSKPKKKPSFKAAAKKVQATKKASKAFKHQTTKKKTTWGFVGIDAIKLSTQGRNLGVTVEGEVYFAFFKKRIAITTLEYTSSPSVRFVVEKGKTDAEKEEEEKEKEENEDKAAGSRPDDYGFEIASVEGNIDLGESKNTYFEIKGRVALNLPSFKIKVGRIKVGGNKWGGQFSVIAVNPKWMAEGSLDMDIEKTNGKFKISYAVSGKLWIGASNGKKGQSDNEIQVAFTFANNKEKMEISFVLSREKKQKASGFQILRFGGGVSHDKKKGRWKIWASAGFSKGKGKSELKIDIEELSVSFGGGKGFVLELKSVEVVQGDRFEAKGVNLKMDFENKIFQGHLEVEVNMKGRKIEGSATWKLDFKYHKYGLVLGLKFPIIPGVDFRGKLYVGNDIQGVMKIEPGNDDKNAPLSNCSVESTKINQGFYLVAGIGQDWHFDIQLLGKALSVYASFGYKIQAAIGIQVVPPVFTELGFAAGAYFKAGVRIFGKEVVSISAEACLMAKLELGFNPYYVVGVAKVYVRVEGCLLKMCKSAKLQLKAIVKRGGKIKFKASK